MPSSMSYPESRTIQCAEGWVSIRFASFSARSVYSDATSEIPDDSGWVCLSTKLGTSMYGWLFG